jgi:hypothetical protein
MISKFYRLLIFGLTSLASALAQVPTDEGLVHFRTLGWQVAPNDLYFESKGKDIKLSVIESARSVFQLHAKAQSIVFYRLIPGPEGKLVREEACTANISAAGPWPLIVFMKSDESPKRYRTFAISDDLKKFPIPSCRFINLTTVDIYAKHGEQRLKVPVKGIEKMDSKLTSAIEPEAIYTTLHAMIGNAPQMLYSNNWVMRPTQRTLVFIFPQDGSLQVMRIVDDLGQYALPATPETKP